MSPISFVETAIAILIFWVGFTQIVFPLWRGERTFPRLRKRPDTEDKLKTINELLHDKEDLESIKTKIKKEM